MGIVYAAYDPELDRRVALKVLAGDSSDPGDFQRRVRLQREAQALAKISHPNVITVHDVGRLDEQLFIAMELVEGGDLRQWLAAETRSWQQILEVMVQAGRGLAAAHELGLLHRDFKPGNMLIGHDGLVRVVDFGLARRFGASGGDARPTDELEQISGSAVSIDEPLTMTGALAGTPAYMSPEQHARGDLDALSDQFSFCITAYEALYGRRPYDADSRAGLMYAVTSGEIVPPPKGLGRADIRRAGTAAGLVAKDGRSLREHGRAHRCAAA